MRMLGNRLAVCHLSFVICHSPSVPYQAFSAWYSRRSVEPVMVVGVELHSIFGLRLGTLAIAYGLLYWQYRYLSRKILALPELAKIPRLLFRRLFPEYD
jgi:hypothetical protein